MFNLCFSLILILLTKYTKYKTSIFKHFYLHNMGLSLKGHMEGGCLNLYII